MSFLLPTVVASILVWVASIIYKRSRHTALSDIPGPYPQSIFTGNYPELSLPDCGVTEREWQEKYGQVVRMKSTFGEDQLWIADPKAMQHILHAGYSYKKLDGQRAVLALMTDRGLISVDGDVHKRQRKVMLPAFGVQESKSFMPAFRNAVESLVDKWNDQIESGPSGKSMVFNIPAWLSKATLDAIGIAAFDYDFGAVKSLNNPLTKSYEKMTGISSRPSYLKLFWENLSNDIPIAVLYFIYELLPGAGIKKLRENRADVHKVAKKLYNEKKDELRDGGGSRDVMSLLVKANASENEKTRLDDEEIIAQMRTIMLAGHDTTSNSVTWALYELAQHPEIQARLRAEIFETRVKAQARGDGDITVDDFDNMPYTVAVMKEALRLDTVVIRTFREALKDDVIPLYTPITTTSGKVVKEIAVPKGTRFWISVHGYHSNKEVWGPDAHEFNPDRWLVPKNKEIPTVGLYGNLMAFSGGVRGCIGWRFAVIEMQTFLISLISNFEFSFQEGATKVRKDRAGLMLPVLEGEPERGVQLPLLVTPVSRTS